MAERVGGIIFLKANGEQFRVKGGFTYDLGQPKRDAVMGHDGPHGYKEVPKVPYIEGEITDGQDVDQEQLQNITDATITLELANGKVVALREGWYAGDGTTGTEEGNTSVRFEGMRAEEIT